MCCHDTKCKYFLQMVPYDLPLHAGMMPRLLITIVGEPVPGADRYEQDSVNITEYLITLHPSLSSIM